MVIMLPLKLKRKRVVQVDLDPAASTVAATKRNDAEEELLAALSASAASDTA